MRTYEIRIINWNGNGYRTGYYSGGEYTDTPVSFELIARDNSHARSKALSHLRHECWSDGTPLPKISVTLKP
jgi:hypothetical protein